jgi:hypothetical protein
MASAKLALLLLLALPGTATAATLGVGLTDGPGGAKALRRSAPFTYRYQYLAGGVNTGDGWPTWNPNGSFVTMYARESFDAHITPVFTLYTIRQSLPGRDDGDEARADLGNLSNVATMRDWYANARLLFKRAGAFKRRRVIVHVEPDLWGYVQQAAAKDDASKVKASVSSTGDADLKGLPNNVSGFARAVVRLRNKYAPGVRLGYHLSVWGTKTDIALQNPPDRQVDALGRRAARFYKSLHARFDMTFAEFDDRDSGFNQFVLGDGGASWWNAADFRRDARFDRVYSRKTRQRIVKWQIPLGNTLRPEMNDTWGHYRDNRVQWLLGGSGGRKHLRTYRDAGVIALLFGGGADGTTCACDADHDGVDDDGGYFKERVRAYYKAGPLKVP